MHKPLVLAAVLALIAVTVPVSASAQAGGQACLVPDSLDIRGNERLSRNAIITEAGIQVGDTLDYLTRQRAVRNLYLSAFFDEFSFDCALVGASRRPVMIITVRERPLIHSVEVVGAERIAERQIRDKLLLVPGRVADPSEITRARVAVDSMYRSKSFYLSRITVDSSMMDGRLALVFRIAEGRRLAISGVSIEGNSALSDEEIVAAMATRPEGLLWNKSGEYDEVAYQTDLVESIPDLYASRGFIDMRVLRDTLIVNPEIGKGQLIIEVEEGPRYQVGSFEIIGNRYFATAELQPMYPFQARPPTVTERLRNIFGSDPSDENYFDQARWDAAARDVWSAYQNEGFRDADVVPVVDRSRGNDSSYVVNLRWEISEREQAVINRIDFVGNLYTVESCIRDRLTVFPGSVYSEDRLIQSMQSIQSMGFFEDIEPPTFETVNDSLGLLNVTFSLTEKKTGSVNFGASMGGAGGGIGGFVGFDQPNLFGKCKSGSLNWQFGSLINEFSVSYTDPSIRKSSFSGSTSLYHLRSRYTVADFGQQTRTGGSVRIGFPFFNAFATRAFISYGGEAVKYTRDDNSLLGSLAAECDNCFRSSLGFNVSRDTRLGLPFPNSGVYQSVDAQFNGGPFGGTANFQRYTTEFRSYVPMGQVGGDAFTGAPPIRFMLGLTLRSGFVFGNTGPFFPNQEFAMGGVQQGESMRGYEEFTITPFGYVTDGSALQATRQSFGEAFMSTTVEFGARLSQGVYTNVFFDAGNVWRDPRDFDPTRMFRGAGIGVSLVTPLGPLGVDYAYGFDRKDINGRPDPGWKLHFKLGQIF